MNLGSSPKLKVGPWLADQTFGERMVRNGFGRVDPIVSAERGRTGGWIVHVGAHDRGGTLIDEAKGAQQVEDHEPLCQGAALAAPPGRALNEVNRMRPFGHMTVRTPATNPQDLK
jgi:hypothetical protein